MSVLQNNVKTLKSAWVAIELMTFGNVVKLIQNISDDKIQSLKMDRFSKKFNIQKFQTLISWMNVLHQMRNYCGHHNRLFNRNFPAPTAIKKSLSDAIPLVRTKPNPDKRSTNRKRSPI
ncbi:Abi family protein [Aliivibrio fischeri]|uniref:Abi family protein n=1 Tax=Aliivibrio fischeri TaxID=668 RepID=UPI003F75B1B9